MTIFTSIIIKEDGVSVITTEDVKIAENIESNQRSDPAIRTQSFGDINGKAYTVLYYREDGNGPKDTGKETSPS